MKKKMVGLFAAFMMCTIIGCRQQARETIDKKNEVEQSDKIDLSQVKNIGSKIAENELYVVSENMNICFYKNFTHMPYLEIDCLSSSKVNTDEVKIYIDIDTPYNVTVTEMEEEKFDLDTFHLFTGYNGEKEKKLKEKDETTYREYQKKFKDAYNKVSENEIGELHHYLIKINFDLENSVHTEKFHNIQITYNGRKKEQNIGEIVIDCEKENPKKENSLYASCIAVNDIYLSKNPQGYMDLKNSSMYKAGKKVKINDIHTLNKDTKIENCIVSIHSSKENYDLKWEGKTLDIEPESELGLDILFIQDNFKDKVYCQCSDYLVIEYKEGTKEYKTGTELYFKTRMTGYQLYAYFLEGIEIEAKEK
ncbi:MAG: hypothetical protein HFJ09_10880 [Lachnospiraceae bacterium]|nr:hypothetical protein [Lachnospiraceae bacterium]